MPGVAAGRSAAIILALVGTISCPGDERLYQASGALKAPEAFPLFVTRIAPPVSIM
jgi:hypothetical protein